MRQSRRGAPFGWLLALLLPLLVSGGVHAGGVTALLGHAGVTSVAGEHRPLLREARPGGERRPRSHQVLPSGEQHLLTTGHAGTGAGGGHPAVAGPAARHLPPASGAGPRPAGADDPRPLAALLVRPARAPPSTGV
ncbi:hypothetical protein [Streptosporangium sp. NPDC003464]